MTLPVSSLLPSLSNVVGVRSQQEAVFPANFEGSNARGSGGNGKCGEQPLLFWQLPRREITASVNGKVQPSAMVLREGIA